MNYNMFEEIDYFTNLTPNSNQDLMNNNLYNDNDSNSNINMNLYSPYEGYIKGNLFKNLYDSYKNYKPAKINVSNEREEMLLNVGQLSFARHELNLLLDNYPNNREVLNLFNRYKQMEDEQVKNYERRFGPLTITGNGLEGVPFKWVSEMWPWEM